MPCGYLRRADDCGKRARRGPAIGRAPIALVLAAAVTTPAAAAGADAQLAAVAREARQVIAVVDGFYQRHHACPQPTRPGEWTELQSELGDGYALEAQGQFVAIRGIPMPFNFWLYYTSPQHPDKCTLWRKLGWDPALIWRRHREGSKWVYDPGDGGSERVLHLAP